jgi:aldehyde dehydrogenase (NAD+)
MTQAPARPQSGSTFESLNPATGDVVGTHPVQTADEVRAAVDRARQEAAWWGGLTFGERKAHLNAWKTSMTQRLPELAELMRLEMGKPIGDAMLVAGLAMEHVAWAAGHAGKVLGRRRVSSGLMMVNQSASVAFKPQAARPGHRADARARQEVSQGARDVIRTVRPLALSV